MDNLKSLILTVLTKYIGKLNKGYPLDKPKYAVLLEAMRMVEAIETYPFSDVVSNSVISYYTIKLKTL